MKRLFTNSYSSFNDSLYKKYCTIQIDKTSFVPQGVCQLDDYIVVACYDSDYKSNSVLFVYNNKEVKKIYLDGKYHCGGISYHKSTDSFFVTGVGLDEKSFINKYWGKDILNGRDSSTVYVQKVYLVDNDNLLFSTSAKHSSPSFLTVYKDYLFVGNYVDYNKMSEYSPVLKKYKILANGDLSVLNEVINNPFSNTQGICLYEYKEKLFYLFSRSFGRKRNSLINICELVDDSFICHNTVVMPSMLEQINVYNDKIVSIFESCARCYSYNCISYNDGVYLLNFSKLLKCDDNKKCFSKGKSLFSSDKFIDIKGLNGQN